MNVCPDHPTRQYGIAPESSYWSLIVTKHHCRRLTQNDSEISESLRMNSPRRNEKKINVCEVPKSVRNSIRSRETRKANEHPQWRQLFTLQYQGNVVDVIARTLGFRTVQLMPYSRFKGNSWIESSQYLRARPVIASTIYTSLELGDLESRSKIETHRTKREQPTSRRTSSSSLTMRRNHSLPPIQRTTLERTSLHMAIQYCLTEF
jgi:hypothetical protein